MSKINVFKVRHQVGAQTYLAPEFVGSYRDCQGWLLDLRRQLVSDRAWDANSVQVVSRNTGTGMAALQALHLAEGTHVWAVTP